jgi:hypothetical protein
MAKGIAVVSGSNNVVFKALETGVIVAGSSTTDAVVSITGSLGVTDLVTLENGITLSGGDVLVLDGKLSASSNLEAGGNLDVEGTSNLKGKLTVEAGDLEVQAGDVKITGSAYISTDLSASQDLKAGRHLIAGGNLDVEGTGNLKGKLTIQTGGLEIDAGETILADKLTVEANGAYVTGEVSASSNLKAGGNLDVEGTSNLKGKVEIEAGDLEIQAGAMSASSNISAGGDLDIEGASNLKGKLTVEVGGADITGDADFRDNVVIHGNLEVKGDTTVTTDNLKNMTVEDAITQFGIGADAASQDVGFVFGDSNSRAMIVDGGVFKLGTTSDGANSTSVTVADDGILVLGQVTASVGILAKDVYIQDTLIVEDNVTLGQDSADVVTINGQLTASANALLQEDVTMGTDSDDLIKVVGQIRMPIFTVASGHANHVAGFPEIPADYMSNKAAYNGHMFYLTSSDDTNWTASGSWAQGNKWYFNERGDWHASFLFAE